jgi:neutral ceramidase
MRRLSFLLATALLSLAPLQAAEVNPATWKAGVAVQVITPTEPLWMAGYGSRNKPAEGKLTELYVKALALEDARGGRLVLLTSDLVGIPRHLSESVAGEVKRRKGLPRERLLITCSHTHCGPVLRDSLSDMYDMPPELAARVGPYTDRVRDGMINTIVRALDDLKPARLAFGTSTVRFAVNRRKPTEKGIINAANPEGPVDHDVPVLRVQSPEGKLRAVVFGYACHNTTLQFYQWCGDYAGFAQQYLEEKHPGAVALFWIGCGGDANPLPRSTVELCRKYGRELADAVEGALAGKLTDIRGDSAARYATIELPFAKLPTKEQLAADRLSKQFAVRRRAERLSKVLAEGGKLDDHYRHYPVQVWRLGELTWVALGGEVVVDYALRLKRELGRDRPLWVTAYANDVMAYIPSARVLAEGGYEADSSMIYYGQPSKWAPAIEAKIVGKVHELVDAVRSPAAKRGSPGSP